jgi:GT2 family glycosyltransferase
MEAEQIPARVSALVVSRNCAGVLRQCLAALERTVPREILEILVVDNGSQDESARLDSEFTSVQYLRLPKNFGLVKAWNIGIRTAKGEFVFLLPAQTVVGPSTIATLVERLEADPSAGAVTPYIAQAWPLPGPSELKQFWSTRTMPGGRPVPADQGPVAVEFPMGAPVLIRRGFLTGMNYFDNRFGSFGAELELYWRLHDAGRKVIVQPDVLVELLPTDTREWSAEQSADVASGAAAFLGKHRGFGASLGFRLGVLGSLLGGLVTFKTPGYNFKLLSYVIGGQKLDGTQE